MRILLDIDGVCADFITPCLAAITVHTGKQFDPTAIDDWDIMKALHIAADDAAAIYRSMQVPGLCRSMPVYPGAVEGVQRLRAHGDVWAVTAPFGGPHWMHERDQWLVEELGFRKADILHVRSDAKHAIKGDVLVEDKTSTLVRWQAHHPTGRGVLFQRRYNERDGWPGAAATTWSGVVAAVLNQAPEL